MLYLIKKFLKQFLPFFILKSFNKFQYLKHYIFVIKPNLKKQLNLKGKLISDKSLSNERILFPIVETSHYQHLQLLILAKALQLRGADVKILICDGYLNGCEIKSIKNNNDTNPCWNCKQNIKRLLPFFELDTLNFSNLISKEKKENIDRLSDNLALSGDLLFNNNINYTNSITDSITRYYYGSNASSLQEYINVKKSHISTALITFTTSEIISEWKPTKIISGMSVYSIWEPIKKYFESKKVPYYMISINQFNFNSIQVNWPELYSSRNRFDRWLKNRNYTNLTKAELAVLNDFMYKRYQGDSELFSSLAFFSNNSDLEDILKIDYNKFNIFLFSNIFWDIGLSDINSIFNGVVEWVLHTIDILKDNTEIHLYIKPHPGEIFDSSKSLKGVIDHIFEKYPTLPNNVTIIDPIFKINTYSLIPFIDRGLFYNGTFGLELLLNQKQIIICADAPYSFLPGVVYPKNLDKYKSELLDTKNKLSINRSEIELFAFFYFIKTTIPWTLTKKAYGDNFSSFEIDSLNDLFYGKNKYLDHLINCIIYPNENILENW